MSPFDDNPPVNLQLMQAAAIALSDADGDYKIAARILRDLSAVDGTLRKQSSHMDSAAPSVLRRTRNARKSRLR